MARGCGSWHRCGVGFSALTGLVVAIAVLAAAALFGVWRARRDGRLRPAGASARSEPRQTPSDEGHLPTDRGSARLTATDAVDDAPHTGTLAGLGVPDSAAVTLLQFSSAFCAPCRATRRVLADVAALLPGVEHIEVDAESHLDAVRELGIWRTPTTLVVAGGTVVQRASGVPAKAQVVAALAALLPDGNR